MTAKYFKLQIVMALYYSSRVSSCKDMDTNQDYFCVGYSIFADYSLNKGQPTNHYFKNRNAK